MTESWVHKLCATLTPIDPEFTASIKPATDADVIKLVALIEHDLPADYADYLAVMGGYDGGLFYEERCDTRLSRIIRYCEGQKAAGRNLRTASCVPFAIGIDIGGYCLATTGTPVHPPVAVLDRMEPGEIVFPNLSSMAFAEAFYFEMAATGRTVLVTGLTGETPEMLADRLVASGYQAEWFSSATRTYFRAGNRQVILLADRPERPTLEVGARDGRSFVEVLADQLYIAAGATRRERRQKSLAEIREVTRQIGWA